MMTPKSDVLLTGATGFLGHYVLASLLRSCDVRCRVLLRSPMEAGRSRLAELLRDLGIDLESMIESDRVCLIEGELPESFDPSSLRGATSVIHAAANTSFESSPQQEPVRTNVEGTRALLGAADAAGIRHVMFISTAYVCGTQTGCIREKLDASRPTFHNAYEASKWEAEQLVRQWSGAGRVSTILRPGILFGDQVTGRITNFGGIYLIARATEILSRAAGESDAADRHEIPLRILGDPDATSNLVPVDAVAQRIVDVSLDRNAHGMVHHLTNPCPPTHLEIKEWLEEHFNVAGGSFSDETWPLRDPNHYEELFYSLGNVVRDYFRSGLTFESRWQPADPSANRLVTREDFQRSLCHAQTHNWGRGRPKAAVPENGSIDPAWYFQEFLSRSIPNSSVAKVHALTTVVGFGVGSLPHRWACRFDSGRLVDVRATRNGAQTDFDFWISSDAFADIVSGRRPFQAAFFRGDADVSGNVQQALRMVPIMTEFIKEFPVPHGANC